MALSTLVSRSERSCMRLVQRSWWSVTQVRNDLEQRAWMIAGTYAGQSTVEYALVGALVVIAAAGAMTLLGGEVTDMDRLGHRSAPRVRDRL